MATPAELMETICRVTGVSLPTIVDIDRRLVKAQLRTKTGRGLHAARMTALDAARMLAAMLATPQANAAGATVERYCQTGVSRTRSSSTLYRPTGLACLAILAEEHSFVEGIAALIEATMSGALQRLAPEAHRPDGPFIEISALTATTQGTIRIRLSKTAIISVIYAPPSSVASPDDVMGDLKQSRRITERTIFAVGELLAPEH